MAQKSGYEKKGFLQRLSEAMLVLCLAIVLDLCWARYHDDHHEGAVSQTVKQLSFAAPWIARRDRVVTQNYELKSVTKAASVF
ncbi:hypothetical protein [Paraburkholderia caribensis]|jgi:hypothetical protein|uniref:hypothetical protein n=1 Tax=Paraburkholderia caribensis TaxID=75105 RepID=UPI001591931F|nr:hypothetical protein [Paraburkholderia caribensis]